jgi:hypothetical protein
MLRPALPAQGILKSRRFLNQEEPEANPAISVFYGLQLAKVMAACLLKPETT